ncbi:GNAT family N-acetyltransferase [Streptomyces peucetius]|uniref:GNAT family N-acetyltransferase n=1 Tax=Streptomyces peucetius TaxID=1950 RepID=A0ABY6ICZ0_STRPE|nr:GNAT family protein [Streptomyces peucetius]UYQ63722.1 GNAT family N-acetyltransferase [Streptomyces peucetius]
MTPAELPGGVRLRPATALDAPALTAAYVDNRDHLAPWEPRRPDEFFTVGGQSRRLAERLGEYEAGRLVPWLLVAGDGRVVGTITLSGVVRGPFRSASLGYWTAGDQQGRGLATAAVAAVCCLAADELGLHRIEASALVDNVRSQRVLEKCGFEPIGLAPRYLHIDGRWRDHRLFQRILHDGPPAA